MSRFRSGALLAAWILLISLIATGVQAQSGPQGSAEGAAKPSAATATEPAPKIGFMAEPRAEDVSGQILNVKRVFVDRLTGGETAAQMRDLIISSLQNSKLFVLTENQERADAFLRGAAEDLVYTDQFSSSEGTRGTSTGSGSTAQSSGTRISGITNSVGSRASGRLGAGVSDNESVNIRERKHEALATVRLVNKDGDVIWSTTQESNGAKFRGASADVAEKITRQLLNDVEKLKRGVAPRN
jgi:hypothetical protein